jgi:hypothetical protein
MLAMSWFLSIGKMGWCSNRKIKEEAFCPSEQNKMELVSDLGYDEDEQELRIPNVPEANDYHSEHGYAINEKMLLIFLFAHDEEIPIAGNVP